MILCDHKMNVNKYFKPTPNRFAELTDFIDRSAVKELAVFFPKLIAEIFNPNPKVNWGLRTLRIDANHADFTEVYNFLQPGGPFFRLCYKLLDCHHYEYPYQCLPDVVRKRLEDAGDTSLYRQKIIARPNTSSNCISLNSFEYYMFQFAYHLIDPTVQSSTVVENSSEWDTVYLRLIETYLDHFVPCTTSIVYPQLNTSNAVSIAQQTLKSFSPPSRTSSLIFREEVRQKMSPSPPIFVRTKSSSSAEIWRSELVATLFLDFWLSSKNDNSLSTQKQIKSFKWQMWSVESLPSIDQLRCVRVLLRHLQYFSNHVLPEDCSMNDLKRNIFSNNRRTIYDFLYSTLTQLPVDYSYRLLLEGWFTYIQPWRYTNPYEKNKNLKPNPREGIERRWVSFIAENLIIYTRLYYVALARLLGCDLTTSKISAMIYRLVQVFSQPQLLELITEVEKYLDDSRTSSIDNWNSIIKQNIHCLEKAPFHYDYFHSKVHTQQVKEFINRIEENLPTLQFRRQQLQANDHVSLVQWMKEQISGNIHYSSCEELEKIENYLKQSRQKLYRLHQIQEDNSRGNSPNMNESNRSTNSLLGASSGYDSVDGSMLSNSSLSIDPKVRRKIATSFTYEGDPDLYPIRSWENKFLVRALYYVCLGINSKFQSDLKRLYYDDSIIGGIFRQLMSPPQRIHYFEKRIPPDGYSRRVSVTLPPRISLRWCASYYFIFLCLSLYGILKIFNFSVYNVFLVAMFFCTLYLIMNSVLSPIPAKEDEDDLTSR